MTCVFEALHAAREANHTFHDAASRWRAAASTDAHPARYTAQFLSGHGHRLEKTARPDTHHRTLAAARAAQAFDQASDALDHAIQGLARAIAQLPLLRDQDARMHMVFDTALGPTGHTPLTGTFALHQGDTNPFQGPNTSLRNGWQNGHVFLLSEPRLTRVLRILQSLRPEDISTPLINPCADLPFWHIRERDQRTHFVELRARTPEHALAYAVSCENASMLDATFHIAIEQRVDGVADMIQSLRTL